MKNLKIDTKIQLNRRQRVLLIKNGTVNTITQGIQKIGILIKDKKIVAMGENVEEQLDSKTEELEIIDAEGNFIYPGFIDAHTHLGLLLIFLFSVFLE